MAIIQPQQVPEQAAQNNGTRSNLEITGLENVDLRQVQKIDLRQLEPGQGYSLKILGWIKFDGQYGPYYVVGVEDQNGNIFKFTTNKQLTEEVDKGTFEIGKRYMIACRLKPGSKYTLKSGEEREAKGYSYDIIPEEGGA